VDLLPRDTWFLFTFVFLYNWPDDDLHTVWKLVARQQTIVVSVFCVTENIDTHNDCYITGMVHIKNNLTSDVNNQSTSS
jgi:hypothetical protein